MSATLKEINDLIAGADPDEYDSISYNKYFRDLAAISNTLIDEHNALKMLIAELPDSDLKVKLLQAV